MTPMKKNKLLKEEAKDDDISKKFDEMEEILLELQKKEEMKGTNTNHLKGTGRMEEFSSSMKREDD